MTTLTKRQFAQQLRLRHAPGSDLKQAIMAVEALEAMVLQAVRDGNTRIAVGKHLVFQVKHVKAHRRALFPKGPSEVFNPQWVISPAHFKLTVVPTKEMKKALREIK
ncbi:MAG: hypothetical protein Q7R39_11050 [Dehalococcoidia bacterium]|nr:hypothetical protein [Dehalococcoidia bacterium]